MEIRMSRCRDTDPEELMVFGDPKHWPFGGEVRKGRPRQIWVRNPSVRYLRTLAIPAENPQMVICPKCGNHAWQCNCK
jgi:hypothetical protein